MSDAERGPIDPLIDLFVYAPLGLLYDYDEVLDRLVTKGKSQVQLAKVLGTMAARQGESVDMVEVVGKVAARGITDIGRRIGLAPPASPRSTPSTPPTSTPAAPKPASAESTASPKATSSTTRTKPRSSTTKSKPKPSSSGPALPIASYETLTARQIIPLLADLSPEQRIRIARFEATNRNRKTVLAKLDALAE